MGLLSIFKRQDPRPPTPGLAADVSLVERARTSARRRLIGAVVLLAMGVVAFPLVFETQPRPIPVDIPIEIPRKEGQPPLALPPPKVHTPSASRPTPVAPAAAEAKAEAAPAPATTVAPPAKSEPKVEPKTALKVEPKPEPKAEPKAAAKPEAKVEPKPESVAGDAGRFVIQVGAFAEAAAVREVRGKVEKLGLATYTQVVETAGGSRTRVRVGPFTSREDADRAASKLKAAGLPGAVLTL